METTVSGEIGIEKMSLLPHRYDEVHIAFAVDARYVQHMGVAMTSIIINNPEVNLHFHVVYDSIYETDFAKLKRISASFQVPMYFYRVVSAPLFDNLKTVYHISKAVYYRLLLPYILPQQLERVIFLDADLVCIGDITRLWRVSLGHTPLAAKGVIAEPDQIQKLALKSGRYLLAGAVLLNMPVWRQQELTKRVIQFIADFPERIEWLEQDALSAILDGEFTALDDAVHTVIDCATESGTIADDSVIIHFAGMCKPWQEWCPDERRSLYWQYLKMSPWFDAAPEESTTLYQTLFSAMLENKRGNHAGVQRLLGRALEKMH